MSFVYLWVLLLIPVVLFLLRGRLRRTSLQVSSVGLWTEKDAGRARYLWIPVFLRRLALVLLLVSLALVAATRVRSFTFGRASSFALRKVG